MNWAAILFGWPLMLAAILASLTGLLLRRPSFVWCGAALALPFMLYVIASPRVWPLAALAAPSHVFAAVAAGRRRWGLAWPLFAATPVAVAAVAACISAGPP